MSGGVDSSVSAALLQDQGYDVVGITMQVWDYSSQAQQEGCGTCCSSVDVEDARAVCQKLDIPFYVLNCEERFKKDVINRFTASYLKGDTPVPCIDCNTYLKFDHLVQKMHELDCDFLATGHYAQIKKTPNGRYHIYKSTDDWKDQTYFLFTIQQNIIPHLLFPVGGKSKPEIRRIAEQKGLNVFNKKDSTGLCFIGGGGYAKFIQKNLKKDQSLKGPIKKYPTGEVLGEHPGLYHFTYGQRKGLSVASQTPLYVIKIDTSQRTLWVGDEKYLYSSRLEAVDWNWLDEAQDGERVQAKIRFHHAGACARIYKKPGRPSRWRLDMEEPQKAITPGQAVVVYRGGQLLGGGRIVLS